MHLRKFCSLVSILLLLSIFAGCGGGSTSSSLPPVSAVKSEFVYVRTSIPRQPDAELLGFKLDATTGSLTQTSDTTTPVLSGGFAVDPNGKFSYLSSISGGVGGLITTYSLDPTSGAPIQNAQFGIVPPPCPAFGCTEPINNPGPLVMSPDGKFIFYGSNTVGISNQVIGALAVNDGTVSLVPGAPFQADQAPFALAVHPSGHFLYTENVDASSSSMPVPFPLKSISGYAVASDGGLTPVPHSPFIAPGGMNLAALRIHPSGKYLYVASGTSSDGVTGWSINQTTGELTALSPSPFGSGTQFGPGTFDSTGKILYLPLSSADGIAAFSADPNTGNLTALNGSPFTTTAVLNGLSIDPSGQFLLGTDSLHNTISVYKIDAATAR